MKRIFHNDGIDPQPLLNIAKLPAHFRIIEFIHLVIKTTLAAKQPVELAKGSKRRQANLETKIAGKSGAEATPLPGNTVQVMRPEFSLVTRRIEIGGNRAVDIDEMHLVPEAAHGARQLENPAPRAFIGGNDRKCRDESDFHERTEARAGKVSNN
ncbi:hypothetical protein D3C80_1130610 [compost metagenome]